MVLVQCGNSCFLSSWAFWKDLLAGKKESVNADIKLCVLLQPPLLSLVLHP
jgi:hypothetical protein